MIVVAGESLIDLIVQPDGSVAASPGGGPFNTARTIGRLGGDVAFLGCLSADRFGRRLSDELREDGVDLSLAMTTDLPTTLAIAELDGHGSAVYRFHTAQTAAPMLDRAAVDAALARTPAALHVGTLGLVLEPMASALAGGVERSDDRTWVMLDANCRPSAIGDRATYLARLAVVAARADIIKASADDLAYIAPGTQPIEAAGALIGGGRGFVLLTDGDRPVVVIAGSDTFEVPVPSIGVVDSVGAGDAFGGAFLARWTELAVDRAAPWSADVIRGVVTLAIEVANRTCERTGADPPHRADIAWPGP